MRGPLSTDSAFAASPSHACGASYHHGLSAKEHIALIGSGALVAPHHLLRIRAAVPPLLSKLTSFAVAEVLVSPLSLAYLSLCRLRDPLVMQPAHRETLEVGV